MLRKADGFTLKATRTYQLFLAAICCLVVALSCLLPVPALAQGKQGYLTVGVPSDRCPIFYPDPDTGKPTGIGVDLMDLVADEAGYDATFKFIGDATLKEALDSNSYDVVMPLGSAIKSDSGKSTVVSENLMQTPFTLVTTGEWIVPDFDNLKVGMLKSLAGGADTVKQLYPGIEIIMYDSMADSVDGLRKGEVDALLHNSYVWSYVLQKPAYSDLKVQPSAMFSMDFRAGAIDTPENQALIEKLNEGISSLSETQQQAVILDYTSRRLYQYDLSDYLHQYGIFLVLTLILIVVLALIGMRKVRAFKQKQEEEKQRLIDRDSLTGVLSLVGFRKKVRQLIEENPDTRYLLSYNNIKNFKFINSSMGRQAGDELLRFWASKLNENLGDNEAIGRIEGDHFVVLRHAAGEEQIALDEKAILDPVRNFFIDRGEKNLVQICSGFYALAPEDYKNIDVDHMIDCARVAEKRIREMHRDGYEFYNPEQWEKGKRAAEISEHLPLAIQQGEIQVWYQPQVNFETGEITGAEALCRWKHAKLGWLSPGEFIPILEDSGLIYELDSFIWEQVCRDLQRWYRAGHYHRCVSVNIARSNFAEGRDIPGQLHDLVLKYGLDVSQLRVEITEMAYVEDSELLLDATMKLRELGFQVEMDDFGSGYSSLHMLKEIPVDRIKLDLNFLSGAGDPERGRVIVSYMIQMVSALAVDLIAEGVENASRANFLRDNGCPEMQGFYFHKPMPVADFEKLLEEQDSAAGDAKEN